MSQEIALLPLLKELIAKPSITPDDAGAMDVVINTLKQLGFAIDLQIISGDNGADTQNLYAKFIGNTTNNKNIPNLCFAGHTDVVPTGDIKKWQFDPFTATVKNDAIYGRGIVDMKGAIVSYIIAIAKFLESNQGNFSGIISLLITGDEEGDAINGTKKMLQHITDKQEKISLAIVGEPTSNQQLGDMIKIGRRGSVSFNLQINGVQGHVAYPEHAKNPIPALADILHKLQNHQFDTGNEHFQPTNLEVTGINSATDIGNIIPAHASANFNIRFNDNYNAETLITIINDICDAVCNACDIEYNLEYRISGEAFLSTVTQDTKDMLANAIKSVTKTSTEFSTSGGTSDARFITNYCPVIEFGLLNKTAHKIDESANLQDLENLALIYQKFITDYFG